MPRIIVLFDPNDKNAVRGAVQIPTNMDFANAVERVNNVIAQEQFEAGDEQALIELLEKEGFETVQFETVEIS